MDEYEEDLAFFEELDRESHPFLSHYLFGEDSEADKYLGRLIAHGFVQKYKDEWDIETYFNRLEEELWTIKTISDNINQPIMMASNGSARRIKSPSPGTRQMNMPLSPSMKAWDPMLWSPLSLAAYRSECWL